LPVLSADAAARVVVAGVAATGVAGAELASVGPAAAAGAVVDDGVEGRGDEDALDPQPVARPVIATVDIAAAAANRRVRSAATIAPSDVDSSVPRPAGGETVSRAVR
jgi:hypothetical protein